MGLIGTKVDVVTRTAPLAPGEAARRLTADGLHGACRLQACLYVVSAGATWTVQRYAYRLTGGAVGRHSTVNVKLVSDGATAHVFDSPRDLVNDGRWYVHEHETDVRKDALTYARFEAWFHVPGLARVAWEELWCLQASRRPGDRDAGARVGSRPRHAQDVEGAAKGA